MKVATLAILALLGILLIIIAVEATLAAKKPTESHANPERIQQEFGLGGRLTYLVMGDSTAAGQGASHPEHGIAVASALELGSEYQVSLINVSTSGAVSRDLLEDQVGYADRFRPDVVLISIGANEVTHFSLISQMKINLDNVIDRIFNAKCDAKIVLTGSPEMGSVPRFAQPLRWVAGVRTSRVNKAIADLASERSITFAPIAKETGPAFKSNPALFASDGFHPNDEGYALWTPVITRAVKEAIATQPSRC